MYYSCSCTCVTCGDVQGDGGAGVGWCTLGGYRAWCTPPSYYPAWCTPGPHPPPAVPGLLHTELERRWKKSPAKDCPILYCLGWCSGRRLPRVVTLLREFLPGQEAGERAESDNDRVADGSNGL